jgi:lipopolysaccharide heptosyltransferase II
LFRYIGNKSSRKDVNLKILILRFSSLGDIVMATPLPRVLKKRFPNSNIDMVVRSDFKELIEWNQNIDNKIYLEKGDGLFGLIKLIKKIRSSKYDLIVDAHRSIRSFLICLFTLGVQKTYFNKRTLKRLILIFFKINLFKKVDLQILEYIKPLNKLGVFYDENGTELFLPTAAKQKVEKIINKIDIKGNRKIIGLVPGAHWPGKRWPAEKFKDLVNLIQKNMDAEIFIVGAKKDKFCKHIAEGFSKVHSFAGQLSMIESAALLSKCDVVVSNDTGMMHVAESVGVDVIGIMGPTSKEFGCYPYRQNSRVVELKMWCRPCSKNGKGMCIRFGKRPCLNNIDAVLVFDTILKWYDDKRMSDKEVLKK